MKLYTIRPLVWTENDTSHTTWGGGTFYAVTPNDRPYAGNAWHVAWKSVFASDKGEIDLGSLDECKKWCERDYVRRVELDLVPYVETKSDAASCGGRKASHESVDGIQQVCAAVC